MRRKLAAATMAAGLLVVVTACADGGESTEDLCETIETEGFEAAERMDEAGADIRAALAEEDEAAALVAVTDAQNAAADLVDVLREAADDAEEEDFGEALETWADELEALMDGLDPAAIEAGEAPDDSGMQEAAENVEEMCDQA